MKRIVLAILIVVGLSSAVWAGRQSQYPIKTTPSPKDRILITDSDNEFEEMNIEVDSLPGGVPSWFSTSTAPTARQILQADTNGVLRPTSIFEGLINDAGTTTEDLWSADKIINSMTAKLAAPGPIGSTTPSTGAFTQLTATSFDFGAPATGQTGEIGLQEDPANGNNIVTLKAPAALANDLVITLPTGVVPSTASDTCTAGQWWYDSSYWYVCVAANTWKRAALATW